MFSPTAAALRAKGYNNRVMVYAHRRQRARYLAPKAAHVRSPLAHKQPEEYAQNWDIRSGVEWHNRLRRRGHYRHWPWARWVDDPVRFHEDTTHRRLFAATDAAANEGLPEWNYYAEVGQDYRTPAHFPLRYTAPFIHLYTNKLWSLEVLEGYLDKVAEGTGLHTIEAVAADVPALRRWGERQAGALVPRGVLRHVELVTADVVLYNHKLQHRREQHEQGAVLRTAEMERYYALPYLRGPAMPTTLAQAEGMYPYGKYTYIERRWVGLIIHPLLV
ncbi:hypothetical protein STCU_03614 [Strigomonas culicis]|uniref:Uncharacterized protein n=1 Tax=Strigomonas culicis TaxID=28005 RepID=S9UJZ5_9TRYP|nr:hypothetical protein STCU_03614 [Strigomonas culicis]|eukprot:EPY31117.1 hypothetical protein STCU_03614 [Strigomonas culicis]